ncbi:MAG: hypothetical protein R3325_15075, partial [Thermoanaerobaculia bacterium]|nr:hypothetical protein [Thermoanaerobaculia bacterium]
NSSFVFGQPEDRIFQPRASFFADPNEHREVLRQSTLRVMGRDTGGRALLGSDRTRALSEIVDDTGSYYWLSFSPDRAFDDRVHTLRVEVAGDVRVRSRRGFRDLSRQSHARLATLGAALVDTGDPSDDVRVVLGTPYRAGWRQVELPVRLEVPADRVVFLPEEGGFVARLELRLAAVAAADRHTEVPLIPVTLRVPRLPPLGAVLPFETRVTVARAAHTLAVSLFDPLGGRVLLATAEIPEPTR